VDDELMDKRGFGASQMSDTRSIRTLNNSLASSKSCRRGNRRGANAWEKFSSELEPWEIFRHLLSK